MARFVVATLFVILPIVLSAPVEEKDSLSKGRSITVPVSGGVAATGAVGGNYGQQTAASETHDKKSFGVNYSSDRGTSNQYSNTGLQAAATGGIAQAPAYPIYQYQYPFYPNVYPYSHYPQYPQYPVYPNYGVGVPNVGVPNVGVGVPNLGVGSSVQLPNVGASSGAAVVPGGVGPVPVRY